GLCRSRRQAQHPRRPRPPHRRGRQTRHHRRHARRRTLISISALTTSYHLGRSHNRVYGKMHIYLGILNIGQPLMIEIARRPFKHFTPAEDRIWSMLWEKQIANCRKHACKLWLDGLDALGLQPDRIPDFAELSRRLQDLTGWELVSTDVIFSDGQTWF